MKKLINGQKAIVILLLLLMFNSCKKQDVSSGGGGVGTTITPRITSVKVSSSIVLYNGQVVFIITADNNTSSVTVNGASATLTNGTYVYTSGQLTSNTTFNVVATNADGTQHASQSIDVSVVSKMYSDLIWNTVSNQNNIWQLYSTTKNHYPLGNPIIQPSYYEQDVFYLGDSSHVFLSTTEYTKYDSKLIGDTILFQAGSNYHILQLDKKVLIYSHVMHASDNYGDSSLYTLEFHAVN